MPPSAPESSTISSSDRTSTNSTTRFAGSAPTTGNGAPSDARQTTTQSRGVSQMTRHKEYYIETGDMFFIIPQENTIFCVHSYWFEREAKKFGDSSDTGTGSGRPGDPYILKDVTVREFELFLWVFYNPVYGVFEAPLKDWFLIFKLACRWSFPGVGTFALKHIKKQETEFELVDLILEYMKHEAPKGILLPLFGRLCVRDTNLSEEEEDKLGLKMSCRIMRAREEIRSPGGRSPVAETPGATDKGLLKTVDGFLKLPKNAGTSE